MLSVVLTLLIKQLGSTCHCHVNILTVYPPPVDSADGGYGWRFLYLFRRSRKQRPPSQGGRASMEAGLRKRPLLLAHLHMLALMLGADFCCVFLNSNAKKLSVRFGIENA